MSHVGIGYERQNPATTTAGASKALFEHRQAAKSETGHSTQKPVECMKRPIENNSSPGQRGLRAVQRVGYHDHRLRVDGPRVPRNRTETGLC
jgi:hypothetical protein